MQPASRACQIKPFMVMDVLERAKSLEAQGESIVHMEIGEPDFDTPQCIKEAAIKALEQGQTHYTHSLGLLELRQAICRHYQDEYRVGIEPEQIIVTSGTSPALLLCFAALLEPEQSVIISDPSYACYANFIKFVNGRPLPVRVKEEDGFQYRARDIEQVCDQDTRAIMINSPANPTGTLLDAQELQRLAGIGPYIVSDEIYHGLVYSGKEHSILEFTDQAFVLNGFSKLYAMTGWRLGYLICPKPFVRE
ncbi:MAG: aminotransferase class I/II-fold pyridoxal phosphate-dependent enzyme, partial [Desulfohalobiaceae bacterium]